MLVVCILIFFLSIILPLNFTYLLDNVVNKRSTAKNTLINMIGLFLIFYILLIFSHA